MTDSTTNTVQFEELTPPAEPTEAAKPTATPEGADAGAKPESGGDATPTQFSDADAAETLKTLADMGITLENAHELVAQGRSLQTIAYQLEHNPRGFLEDLERTNPKIFQNVIDVASDLYIERHPDPAASGAGKSSGADSGVMQELRALRARLEKFEQGETQRQQREALAQIEAQYNERVNKYLDAAGLQGLAREAVKALVDKSVSADPATLKRINAGVFVDVPKHVKAVVDRYSAELKASTDADAKAREEVKARGSKPVATAAFPAGGVESAGTWDDLEKNIAALLQKAQRK